MGVKNCKLCMLRGPLELDQPNTSWKKLRDLLLRLECGMRRTFFTAVVEQSWPHQAYSNHGRRQRPHDERGSERKKEEREAIDVEDEDNYNHCEAYKTTSWCQQRND
ncbi:unnamed protein product [Cylicocyclus nassatus]|uniref:Uncharacterized protein n=1 Tax=Cylicocyclus nassatus TaxID=53992 RepID=A0AA36MER3_CYLNA|nr:unnamed protein product [Cylicocyclus nassatus]